MAKKSKRSPAERALTKREKLYFENDFDELKATKICQLLSEGLEIREAKQEEQWRTHKAFKSLTITSICSRVGISRHTLSVWLARYPHFANLYDAAMQIFIDRMVEQALEIADNIENDTITYTDKYGVERKVANSAAVNRAKLQVETRFRIASKFYPERYADKLEIRSKSLHVHVDNTTEGMQLQLKNLLEDAQRRGLSLPEWFAELGLTSANIAPGQFYPHTQNAVRLLEQTGSEIMVPAQ